MVTPEVDLLQMVQVADYHPFMAAVLWNLDLNPLCNVFLHPAVREEVVGHILGFFVERATADAFISRIKPLDGVEIEMSLLNPISKGVPRLLPRKEDGDSSFGKISFAVSIGKSPQKKNPEKGVKEVRSKDVKPKEEKKDDGSEDDSPPDDGSFPGGAGARRKAKKLDSSSDEDLTGASFSGLSISQSTAQATPVGSATVLRPQVAKKTTLSTLAPKKKTPRSKPEHTGETTEEDEPAPRPDYAATPVRGRGARPRTRGTLPAPGFMLTTPRGGTSRRGRGSRTATGADSPRTATRKISETAPTAEFSTPKATAKPTHLSIVIGGDGTCHCGDCQRSFSTFDECSDHIQENHPDLPQFPCRQCGRGFGTRDSLYSHRNRHHRGQKLVEKPTKIYTCPGCKKTFVHRQSKNRHQDDKKCGLGLTWGWQCPVCQKIFANQNARNQHMNVDHFGTPKPGEDVGVVVVNIRD
jgi:hypothetical protein